MLAVTMAKKPKQQTFAERLRAVREAADISQYRLSQLTGLSKQTISSLELGQYKPSWDTVQLIAAALGVSCEEFTVPQQLPPPAPPKRGRPRKGD